MTDKESPEKKTPAPPQQQHQRQLPPPQATYPPPFYGYAMDPNWLAAHGGMMPQYHHGHHGYVQREVLASLSGSRRAEFFGADR